MRNWKYVKESNQYFDHFTGKKLPAQEKHWLYNGDNFLACFSTNTATEEDFKLAAAAPEIFEALENVLRELDDMGELNNLSDETRALYETALNKAKGEL